MTCQWCDGRMTESTGMCELGCATKPIHASTCIDCRQRFATGRFSADQCRPCERKENARYVAESAGDDAHTGYTADMIARGANRIANQLRAPEDVERGRAAIRDAIKEKRSA